MRPRSESTAVHSERRTRLGLGMLHRLGKHGRRKRRIDFNNGRVPANDALCVQDLDRPHLRVAVVRVVELTQSSFLAVLRWQGEVVARFAGSSFALVVVDRHDHRCASRVVGRGEVVVVGLARCRRGSTGGLLLIRFVCVERAQSVLAVRAAGVTSVAFVRCCWSVCLCLEGRGGGGLCRLRSLE
ncbi:hypothetical protein CC86DRAFT_105029 [Ophiobolus disseminans]|uniref:Uncharacterized protein n=1 Tax=Ophiobolus disseminans TaxID=1469910 RepID=A0A6A6ZMP4_9PLEO|nr:hypothetical protein CC86DRAFT_105029 [Ophiobolus disseminans]